MRRGYPRPADLERIAERQARVAELTRQGLSAPQIAEIVGITERTVVRDRSAVGCAQPYVSNPLSEEQRCRAEELLNDGCSIAEVARTIGRSPSAVKRAFPGRGWTRAQVYEYVGLVQSARKIAKRTGVSV